MIPGPRACAKVRSMPAALRWYQTTCGAAGAWAGACVVHAWNSPPARHAQPTRLICCSKTRIRCATGAERQCEVEPPLPSSGYMGSSSSTTGTDRSWVFGSEQIRKVRKLGTQVEDTVPEALKHMDEHVPGPEPSCPAAPPSQAGPPGGRQSQDKASSHKTVLKLCHKSRASPRSYALRRSGSRSVS